MQRESMIGVSRSPRVMAMPRPFVATLAFTAAAVVIGGALLYGPAVRVSLERQWAAEIERENDEICDSLGMTSASSRPTCAEVLARVRRLHEERLSREPIL